MQLLDVATYTAYRGLSLAERTVTSSSHSLYKNGETICEAGGFEPLFPFPILAPGGRGRGNPRLVTQYWRTSKQDAPALTNDGSVRLGTWARDGTKVYQAHHHDGRT